MPAASWNPLLDPPPFPAAGYARLADRIAALLRTKSDVLLVQGEAIIALEALANSLARPDLRALNIVTSPYGRGFGDWLRRGGAMVTDLVAAPGLPVTTAAVAAALGTRHQFDVVSVVHAESASGILNPVAEIAALAHAHGAIVVVDAVASVGGHRLDVDALSVDVAVIGPQKSLGGSAGVAALSINAAAWALIDRPDAPTLSTLSLLDLKANWLDHGRGVLPGMPSALEFHALAAAFDRLEAEGLDAAIARHARAGAATRAGLVALGLPLWVEAGQASNLVTAARLPDGIAVEAVLAATDRFEVGILPAVGPGTERLVRLNHTGPRARFDVVLANIVALGEALRGLGHPAATGAAAAAVAAHYGPEGPTA